MKKAIYATIRLSLIAGLVSAAALMSSCKSSGDDAYTAAMRSIYKRGVPKERLGSVAVVDFTKPSADKRMVIYDHSSGRKSSHLVAHGYGSGMKYAENFSNRSGSGQSSLGLYKIGRPYYGKHGKSLKLHGLEGGLNSRAYSRAIVLHSADYVSSGAKWDNFWAGDGYRIGRSAGCPAVSEGDIKRVLAALPTGSFLYIYAGQQVQLPKSDSHRMLANDGGKAADGAGVPVRSQDSKGKWRFFGR